jgi:archaellum biogenesis ATPase FlaH
MKLYYIENNNEKNIVDIIINNTTSDIFLVNTNCIINNILNMLPHNFDNFADITNNENLLILYNTKIIKVLYRSITLDHILIIIDSKLIIFIININHILLNIIKKLIKLVNNNKIIISTIHLNIYNYDLNDNLMKITDSIKYYKN